MKTTETKPVHFDFSKYGDIYLKHKIDSIKKDNKFLAEHKIKNKHIYAWNTTLMNSENRKTNGQHKFILNLSQRLDLGSSNKHIVLQNLSVN